MASQGKAGNTDVIRLDHRPSHQRFLDELVYSLAKLQALVFPDNWCKCNLLGFLSVNFLDPDFVTD